MTTPEPRPTITVVSPVFNEETVLPELLDRLARVFDGNGGNAWCAILVDDGSRDGTAALVRERAARDPRFRLVQLSRNFGFQGALSAGLAEAAGSAAVVTIDADLQDPPELLPDMMALMDQGADVVYGQRRQPTPRDVSQRLRAAMLESAAADAARRDAEVEEIFRTLNMPPR